MKVTRVLRIKFNDGTADDEVARASAMLKDVRFIIHPDQMSCKKDELGLPIEPLVVYADGKWTKYWYEDQFYAAVPRKPWNTIDHISVAYRVESIA